MDPGLAKVLEILAEITTAGVFAYIKSKNINDALMAAEEKAADIRAREKYGPEESWK